MDRYILLIACTDRKGLIYQITEILFQHDLNIVSNGEFVEKETNTFFMRSEFFGAFPEDKLLEELRVVLPDTAFVQLVRKRKKGMIIMATKQSHCLGDLLIRHYSNSLQ